MSEEFDREEQAFRDAFRRELEGEGFRPLDPDGIRTAAGPARRLSGTWLKGLAAAAAVVLVVGGAGIVLPRLMSAGSAASGSVAAAPAEDRAGAAAGGVSGKDTSDESLPVPAASGAYAESSDWVATAPSPLSPRILASGAWVDGKFYIVGGRGLEPGCVGTAAECAAAANDLRDGAGYDPATDTWQALPDSPVAVCQQAPAVVGPRLYYVAEVSPGQQQDLIVFDTATRAWTRIASPPNGGALVAAGDQLVSVSVDSSRPDQVFDPVGGTWRSLPADPRKNATSRSGAWADGELVVAAALSGSNTRVFVETLDLRSGTWRKLSEGRSPLPTIVAVGHYLLVGDPGGSSGQDATAHAVGGRVDARSGVWRKWSMPGGSVTGSGSETVVGDQLLTRGMFYDPAHDSWTGLVLPDARNLFALTSAGSPDGLLVFGGADGDGLSADAYYLPVS